MQSFAPTMRCVPYRRFPSRHQWNRRQGTRTPVIRKVLFRLLAFRGLMLRAYLKLGSGFFVDQIVVGIAFRVGDSFDEAANLAVVDVSGREVGFVAQQ